MPRCSGKEGCDLTDRIDLIDRAISSAVNKVSLVNGVPEFHGKKKARMNGSAHAGPGEKKPGGVLLSRGRLPQYPRRWCA